MVDAAFTMMVILTGEADFCLDGEFVGPYYIFKNKVN